MAAASSAQPSKSSTQAGRRAAPAGESKGTGDKVTGDKAGPKKRISNQTGLKPRALRLCFLVPMQETNCNWAGGTALGLGSARGRLGQHRDGACTVVAHGTRVSPLCSPYA